MKRLLFVDDDEIRVSHMANKCKNSGYDMVWAKDMNEAVQHLAGDRFDVVSLDHDLGTPTTGCDIAKHMAGLPLEKRPNAIIVHSHNPVGAMNMVGHLRDAGFSPIRQPFVTT